MDNPPHVIHGEITYEKLLVKLNTVSGGFSNAFATKMRRAVSWVGGTEMCKIDNNDAKFIFFWIAFNAMYSDKEQIGKLPAEKRLHRKFFRKIHAADKRRRIYNAIRETYKKNFSDMIENQYLYDGFWKYINGERKEEVWKQDFENSKALFYRNRENKNIVKTLQNIFDRLYVLRNQLIHGGSTWQSKVNSTQVRDCSKALRILMPTMVDIMMDAPEKDWGESYYPSLDENDNIVNWKLEVLSENNRG